MKTETLLNKESFFNFNSIFADIAISFAFIIGYILFKRLRGKKETEDKKEDQEKKRIYVPMTKFERLQSIRTVQKMNSFILYNNDKSINAHIIIDQLSINGITPETSIFNNLISMSMKFDQKDEADYVLSKLKQRSFNVSPDIITYNILIKCIVRTLSTTNSNSNLNFNLKKEVISESLSEIETIISEIKTNSLEFDIVTYNTVIDAYIEANSLERSLNYFEELRRNIQLNKSEQSSQSESSQSESKSKLLPIPDSYTYNTIIKGLKANINEKNFKYIMEIYNYLINNNKLDEYALNTTLDFCVKFDKLQIAAEIFNSLEQKGVSKSLISFSIMIKGYGQAKNFTMAMEIYNQMRLHNIKPNEIIYDSLLNCAINCNNINAMQKIYSLMIKDGIHPNNIILITLIKGFIKTKCYDLAYSLYNSIPESNKENLEISFFNVLFDCCVENQNLEKLNLFFEDLKKIGEKNGSLKPNFITYSTILKCYCKLEMDDLAKKMYYDIINDDSIVLDEIFFNTIADYFGKKKNINETLSIYEDMKSHKIIRSSVIFSIILKMYNDLGKYNEALEFYNEMNKYNFKSTIVTDTTILQMFIKQKRLDDALDFFKKMKVSNDYKIDVVIYNFIINGCSFNKKLEPAIKLLLESLDEGFILYENTYKNVLNYLVDNKFMKFQVRKEHITNILNKIKEKNVSIDNEVFSKAMKVIYNDKSKASLQEVNDYFSVEKEKEKENHMKGHKTYYTQSYSNGNWKGNGKSSIGKSIYG